MKTFKIKSQRIDEIADDVIGPGSQLTYGKARKFARAVIKEAHPTEVRKDSRSKINLLASAGGVVFVQRTGYSPFLMQEKEWKKLEKVETKSKGV